MNRYCFTYAMHLEFSFPVCCHTFLFRFHPRSDMRQQLWGLETTCQPATSMPVQTDAFGNLCFCGHIEEEHSALDFHVRGDVLIEDRGVAERCPAMLRRPTELTRAGDGLRALMEPCASDPVAYALTLSERIRERVSYQKGATDEYTAAEEAFQRGAGVCQDMAHMLLALLRAGNIPARYVAGLIPGEGETHAWVEVYDGSAFIGVDPTHLRLADATYLAVNRGRDSRDCAINRGVFAGFAQQTMQVHARMSKC